MSCFFEAMNVELSKRQKRRILKDIARRMVNSEVKHQKLTLADCNSDSADSSAESELDGTSFSGAVELSVGVDLEDVRTNCGCISEISTENCNLDITDSVPQVTQNISKAVSATDLECTTVSSMHNSDCDGAISDSSLEDTLDNWTDDDSILSDKDQDSIGLENVQPQSDSQQPYTSLFSGANISCKEFSTMLLSISQKHGMSYSSITDILKLLSHSLPSPNMLPQTNFLLLNGAVDYKSSTTVHRCCGYCTKILVDSTCSRNECKLAKTSDCTLCRFLLRLNFRFCFQVAY